MSTNQTPLEQPLRSLSHAEKSLVVAQAWAHEQLKNARLLRNEGIYSSRSNQTVRRYGAEGVGKGQGQHVDGDVSKSCHLLHLPLELLQAIGEMLRLRDALNFQITCTTLFSAIKRPTYEELVQKEITQKRQARTHMGCSSCKKWLPVHMFDRDDRGCYEYWIVELGMGNFHRRCIKCKDNVYPSDLPPGMPEEDIRAMALVKHRARILNTNTVVLNDCCVVSEWVLNEWTGSPLQSKDWWPKDRKPFGDVYIGESNILGFCRMCNRIGPRKKNFNSRVREIWDHGRYALVEDGIELKWDIDMCLTCWKSRCEENGGVLEGVRNDEQLVIDGILQNLSFHNRKLVAPDIYEITEPRDFPFCKDSLVFSHRIGRNTLYNISYIHHIDGRSDEDSQKLLNMLFKQSDQPKYKTLVSWENNSDVMMWGNTALLHRTTGVRDMQRTMSHDAGKHKNGKNDPKKPFRQGLPNPGHE